MVAVKKELKEGPCGGALGLAVWLSLGLGELRAVRQEEHQGLPGIGSRTSWSFHALVFTGLWECKVQNIKAKDPTRSRQNNKQGCYSGPVYTE